MSVLLRAAAVLFVGTVTLGGCATGTQQPPPPVGDAFVRNFGCEGVSLERNGSTLVARVMDQVAVGMDEAERERRAREMADWLWDRRGTDSGVTEVLVQLVAPGAAGTVLAEFRLAPR